MMVMKKVVALLIISLIGVVMLIRGGQSFAQQAPPQPPSPAPAQPAAPAPPQPPPRTLPERVFSAEFNTVWEKVIEVLKDKGLYFHPHGRGGAPPNPKMGTPPTEDKEKGKIVTARFRNFKISSARTPVEEIDFANTYTILVQKVESSKPGVKVQINRRFEVFNHAKRAAGGQAESWEDKDPNKEGMGVSEEEILTALQGALGG